MKKIYLFPLLFFLLQCLNVLAQDTAPLPLELTHHKTTSLIFPYAIKSVDRGSRDILAQVPAGVENILQVKAALPGMQETNLTVITVDGQLYSFDVRYQAQPTSTRLTLDSPNDAGHLARFPGTTLHAGQLQRITARLVEDERFYYGIRDKAGRVTATVEGIYLYGSTLFFRLVLTNRSSIPYEPDFFRFSLQDRKQARRTARQEEEMIPRYTHGPQNQPVEAGRRQVLVFALDKFTVSPDKLLRIDLFEHQGSRHLQLRVKGRHLLDAAPLFFE